MTLNRIEDWQLELKGDTYSALKTKSSSIVNVLPPARPTCFVESFDSGFMAYTIGNGIYHIKGTYPGTGRFNLDFRLAVPCAYNESGTLCVGNSVAFTNSENFTFLIAF